MLILICMYASIKQKNSSGNNRLKRFLLLAGALSIIAIVAFALERTGVTNFYNRSPAPVTANPEEMINYDPPTEQEANAGNERKVEIIREEEQVSEPDPDVNLVIVDASQYDQEVEIRAFASNIVQNGTCTFTLTRGGKILEKSAPAYADASSTPCITQTIARSEFPDAGNWDLTVTFYSGNRTGSAKSSVEIK